MWSEAGKPMFGALLRDIKDRVSAQQKLEHLAHFDTMTSLPNRNALHAHLAANIATVPCALLLLDLDGFKHVNDSLGAFDRRPASDGGRRTLAAAVERSTFLARLGGDEFAILLPNCADPLQIDELTAQIFEALHAPFELAGQSIFVGPASGSPCLPRTRPPSSNCSPARTSRSTARRATGAASGLFMRAMQNSSEQRNRLGTELRQALTSGQFELWFQPRISLQEKRLPGVEALLRWRHPDHGLLAPQTFLAVL